MPEEQRKRIWDDGLHFRDEGYDLMGELIADRLLELLTEKTDADQV
jgi:lysophospholipase L1-like esterase